MVEEIVSRGDLIKHLPDFFGGFIDHHAFLGADSNGILKGRQARENMAQPTESDYLQVGRVAVQRGYLSREQLEAAIRDLGERAYETMERGDEHETLPELGEILVEKGFLTPDSLEAIEKEIGLATMDEPTNKFGKYTLLHEIGRGGMSVVWEAFDNNLRRRVAVKFLTGYHAGRVPGEAPQEDDTLLRFYREAQTAAQLHHSNIIQIFEVNVFEGRHYIAMEYIEGDTLEGLLDKGTWSQEDLVKSLIDISRAVHFAHEKGILHRDVKPANIMVDRSGQPRVMDFGLARNVQEHKQLTLSGVAIGTPSYMSPEHAQGSKGQLDPKSDVYSLGAVLYEVITGMPPFSGSNPMEVMLAVVQEEPLAPRKIKPEIPRDLESICLCAIRKDPAKRYETAAQFANDLDRYLRGDPIHVRSAFSGSEWGRKAGAIGGIVILILVLLGGTVAMFSNGFARNQTPVSLSEKGRLLFEKGMTHYEKGEYTEAVEAWTDSIEVHPQYSFGWYYRARAYEAMGKSELAIRDLEHAESLDLNNPIFRQELKRIRGEK